MTDQTNHEGLSSTNLFQTQAKIFWSVIGEERTKSSHAPIKNQIFVSTVEVKWKRELHLDSGSVLLMEMEHDNVVEVNRIFTVNIALTNSGREGLNNLVVKIPMYNGKGNDQLYKWKRSAFLEGSFENSTFGVQLKKTEEQLRDARRATRRYQRNLKLFTWSTKRL